MIVLWLSELSSSVTAAVEHLHDTGVSYGVWGKVATAGQDEQEAKYVYSDNDDICFACRQPITKRENSWQRQSMLIYASTYPCQQRILLPLCVPYRYDSYGVLNEKTFDDWKKYEKQGPYFQIW